LSQTIHSGPCYKQKQPAPDPSLRLKAGYARDDAVEEKGVTMRAPRRFYVYIMTSGHGQLVYGRRSKPKFLSIP